MSLRNFIRFGFFLIIIMGSAAKAGVVSQVKNGKALVELTGLEEAQVGDQLFAVDANGKKKALLKITQIKKNKAIAIVEKGNAQPGFDLMLRPHPISREIREGESGNSQPEQSLDDSPKRSRKKSGVSYGVLGEYLMTTMAATFTVGSGTASRTTNVALAGSNFGALGFYDYPLSPDFAVRGLGGFEQYSGTGSVSNPDCGGGTTTACAFSVTYLSLYGQGKWIFYNTSSYRAWAEGGFGYFIAMSKSSNVLSESGLATNQLYNIGAGMDIMMDRGRSFIPIGFDYGMFPASDTVTKANVIYLRAGYGWNL